MGRAATVGGGTVVKEVMLGGEPPPLLSARTASLFLFVLKDFINLFMKDTQRERQRHRQREKQASCREPDVGLDPRTPGS